MKKILFIAHFCNDLDSVGNNRFNYLARMLAKNNEVTFVTTDFSHRKKEYRVQVDSFDNVKVEYIHELKYKKNISVSRIFAHRILGKNLKKYLCELKEKPDVIYCAVPSLDVAYAAIKYGNKNNIKVIIDIQDLWPEAFQLVLNIPFIFYPMKKMADCVYSKADAIISVSDTYMKRAQQVNRNAESKVIYIGTNLKEFDDNVENNLVKKENEQEFVIAYCGSLSKSYDIKCLIDATEILYKRCYSNVALYLMGDGPLRRTFEEYSREKNINVKFFGHIPYPKMCAILSSCDICVNPIISGSAASIINKHADYAASGIPVINSQECEEYRNLVDEYQMGLNCLTSNPLDMAEKIEILINDEELRKRMGLNARRCAEELFDRNITYKELVNLIEE